MDINGYTPLGSVTNKNLISIKELSQNDIFEILHGARNLKVKIKFGENLKKLAGKNTLLLTKNSRERGRIAFEIASRSLNANPSILPLKGSRIEDLVMDDLTFKVIASYGISSIIVDTEVAEDSETISKCVSIPVINANEISGPCVALSAVLTAWEKLGNLSKLNIAIISSASDADFSTVCAFAKCGANITIIAPENQKPSDETLNYFKQFSNVSYTDNLAKGIKNCNIVYACNHDFGEDYFISQDILSEYANGAKFMQAVPLVREKQADSTVIDGSNSLVIAQGENNLHILRSAIYLFSI